ncbi:MAG: sugar phosphate nucleotidyltransferase [Pseudomonadota bacterium]
MALRKGIILAGETDRCVGTMCSGIPTQLLPVYDKPMIYYPLATLKQAGIVEILVVTAEDHLAALEDCIGDGQALGLRVSYQTQDDPRHLAQALTTAEGFLAGAPSALIYGDNLFAGPQFEGQLARASALADRATIFAQTRDDPHDRAVITCDWRGRATAVAPRSQGSGSNLLITGLYLLDGDAPRRARSLVAAAPDAQIVRLLQGYLDDHLLNVEELAPCSAWFDAATPDNLLDAALYVRDRTIRGASPTSCIEDDAHRAGHIGVSQILARTAGDCETTAAERPRQLAATGTSTALATAIAAGA